MATTGDILRHKDTGMIKRLVRDDGERVFLADLGREAEMRSADRAELDEYELVEDLAELHPAASSHAASVEAARMMKAKREGDEEEFEEAAEDFMLDTEASPAEIRETYIEGEPLDQTPENLEVNGDAGDGDGEFAPDLDAVAEDLPEAPVPQDEEGTPTEAEAEATGDTGPVEPTRLPESDVNKDQE